MSIILRLGMRFEDVIAAVTSAPAKALHITDVAGSLRPGMPADITVCRIESGTFEFADTEGRMREADRRIVPVMAFKAGKRYDADLARCQNEDNWLLQIADDHVPEAAAHLSRLQLEFLRGMRAALAGVNWTYNLENLDLNKAHELRDLFDQVRVRHPLAMREALLALYACFLDRPFTMQIGLFLLHLEREALLHRLDEVCMAEVA